MTYWCKNERIPLSIILYITASASISSCIRNLKPWPRLLTCIQSVLDIVHSIFYFFSFLLFFFLLLCFLIRYISLWIPNAQHMSTLHSHLLSIFITFIIQTLNCILRTRLMHLTVSHILYLSYKYTIYLFCLFFVDVCYFHVSFIYPIDAICIDYSHHRQYRFAWGSPDTDVRCCCLKSIVLFEIGLSKTIFTATTIRLQCNQFSLRRMNFYFYSLITKKMWLWLWPFPNASLIFFFFSFHKFTYVLDACAMCSAFNGHYTLHKTHQ